MALDTVNIDAEITRLDGLITTLDLKIEKVAKTLRNHKLRRTKLGSKRDRLKAAKVQIGRSNVLKV